MRRRAAGVKRYFSQPAGSSPGARLAPPRERSAPAGACPPGPQSGLEHPAGLDRAPRSPGWASPSPARSLAVSPPRRVLVRTYGCQMNAHDSEKLENLLLHRGWTRAEDLEDATLLVVNTCSIRDKAEHQLY